MGLTPDEAGLSENDLDLLSCGLVPPSWPFFGSGLSDVEGFFCCSGLPSDFLSLIVAVASADSERIGSLFTGISGGLGGAGAHASPE